MLLRRVTVIFKRGGTSVVNLNKGDEEGSSSFSQSFIHPGGGVYWSSQKPCPQIGLVMNGGHDPCKDSVTLGDSKAVPGQRVPSASELLGRNQRSGAAPSEPGLRSRRQLARWPSPRTGLAEGEVRWVLSPKRREI